MPVLFRSAHSTEGLKSMFWSLISLDFFFLPFNTGSHLLPGCPYLLVLPLYTLLFLSRRSVPHLASLPFAPCGFLVTALLWQMGSKPELLSPLEWVKKWPFSLANKLLKNCQAPFRFLHQLSLLVSFHHFLALGKELYWNEAVFKARLDKARLDKALNNLVQREMIPDCGRGCRD